MKAVRSAVAAMKICLIVAAKKGYGHWQNKTGLASDLEALAKPFALLLRVKFNNQLLVQLLWYLLTFGISKECSLHLVRIEFQPTEFLDF